MSLHGHVEVRNHSDTGMRRVSYVYTASQEHNSPLAAMCAAPQGKLDTPIIR